MRVVGANSNGANIAELTPLEKCQSVQAAINRRRPLTVTEALKKYALSSSVYYR